MGDNKQHYHNTGQADASTRDYSPPHGVVDELTSSKEGAEKNSLENKAYDEGYFGAKAQTDVVNGNYSPPSDSAAKEAYDKVWEANKK